MRDPSRRLPASLSPQSCFGCSCTTSIERELRPEYRNTAARATGSDIILNDLCRRGLGLMVMLCSSAPLMTLRFLFIENIPNCGTSVGQRMFRLCVKLTSALPLTGTKAPQPIFKRHHTSIDALLKLETGRCNVLRTAVNHMALSSATAIPGPFHVKPTGAPKARRVNIC